MFSPPGRVPIIFCCVAAVFFLQACSSRNPLTSTDPGVAPTPPAAGGAGTQTGPPLLTRSTHGSGWARTDCLVCHQLSRLRFHGGLKEQECLGCHGDNGTQSAFELCVVCHGNPPANGAHQRHNELGFAEGCIPCHTDAGILRTDLHRDGTVQVRMAPAYGGAFKRPACSSVFCHGIGTPDWFKDSALGCTDCHDPNGSTPIGARSGQHASHDAKALDCLACHAGPPPTHYNWALDNPSRIKPQDGRYVDKTPAGFDPAGSSGTCSNLTSPCHGLTSEWTAGETCGACHNATNSDPPDSGDHVRHALSSELSYDCTLCHAAYPQRHMNFSPDVSFNPIIPGNASFDGAACLNLYCHGAGPSPLSGGTNKTPVWGKPSSAVCGSCHSATNADPPASGSHIRHTAAGELNYDCTFCHFRYPGAHVDFRIDVVFDGNGLPRGGSFNGTACSQVYCHGAGADPIAGGSNTKPVWGDPAAAICGSCHGAPGGIQTYPPSGQHAIHAARGFPCNTCHAGYPVDHVDGRRTVVFAPWYPNAVFTPGPKPNEGTCSTVGCHGDKSWKG